jgi:hypothetical protein
MSLEFTLESILFWFIYITYSGIDQLGWGLVRSTFQIAMSGNKTLFSKEQRANKNKLKEELEKYPNLDTDTYAKN